MTQLEQCPVCGAQLEEHTPETDKEHEYWAFECYAAVYRHGNRFYVENDCEEITQIAVNKINEAASVPLNDGNTP